MIFYFRDITRISWNSISMRGTTVKTSGRSVWSTTAFSGARTYLRPSGTSPGSSAGDPPSGQFSRDPLRLTFLLPQVQRQDSEADAGTCAGELCQETIIPKVRGRGIIIFIITNSQSSDMFALSTAAAVILALFRLSQFYPE